MSSQRRKFKKYYIMKKKGAPDSEIYMSGLEDGLKDLDHLNMVTGACNLSITEYKDLGLALSDVPVTPEEHQGNLASALEAYFKEKEDSE